jgi:hypothetical protein
MYKKADGEYGLGPFTMASRVEILRRLLQLEVDYNFELITIEELKYIDKTWDDEGDLSRRTLVDLYYEIKGKHLPWDDYKVPVFSEEVIDEDATYDLRQEEIAKAVILYPEKNIVEDMAAVADIISAECMMKSGFGEPHKTEKC